MTEEMQTNVDYLIIGAGPAGLQLAYLLQKEGCDYLVLESADRPGTFFEQFPRHHKLLSINKVYSGYDQREAQLRYDWNSLLCDDDQFAFTHYSKEYFPDSRDYARYLRDFASHFDLRIRYQTRVAEIHRRQSGEFLVRDEHGGEYVCGALIVATGVSRPYLPPIPGIELTENYFDFSIRPEDYINQRVLIIGKGNSAFETANHLTATARVIHLCSPHPIKFAWKTHFFGHLRAVNNDFLDTYILKGQNSVLDATIDRIERVDGEFRVAITFSHAEGQKAEMAYDRVLTCTGFRWDSDFFAADCRPRLACHDRLPEMSSDWQSTNVPGLFFAGTLMQIRDLHKTMSSVLHGFRFNILCLSRIVQQYREADYRWPCERLKLGAEALADKIINRVSTNAGLMHQPGFLCDLIVVRKEADEALYYDILPVDYVFDSRFGDQAQYYVITMEYGEFEQDPFAEPREPDAAKAYRDAYLHPRIRCFSRRELLAEHHISESLENDWRRDDFPGERPLIRAMDFIGQEDPTKFQETHRGLLVQFLQQSLESAAEPSPADQSR